MDKAQKCAQKMILHFGHDGALRRTKEWSKPPFNSEWFKKVAKEIERQKK